MSDFFKLEVLFRLLSNFELDPRTLGLAPPTASGIGGSGGDLVGAAPASTLDFAMLGIFNLASTLIMGLSAHELRRPAFNLSD